MKKKNGHACRGKNQTIIEIERNQMCGQSDLNERTGHQTNNTNRKTLLIERCFFLVEWLRYELKLEA